MKSRLSPSFDPKELTLGIPEWHILQGIPPLAKAIRQMVRDSRSHLCLAVRPKLLFELLRDGLGEELGFASARQVQVRLIGEHDRRLRAYYRDLLQGSNPLGPDRLRLLPIAPPLVALRDHQESIYGVVSGEGGSKGHPVAVRARHDPAYALHRADFDSLWDRAVPIESLPGPDRPPRGPRRDRPRTYRWNCPHCGQPRPDPRSE